MSTSLETERRLLEYLLGRMSEEERVELEERLFGEDDLDEELLATTDDLIHAYLSGALSSDDRVRFEAHVLASPDHRERLAFVRDLLSAMERMSEEGVGAAAARAASPSRPWGPWGLAAAVFVATGFLVLLTRRPSGQGIQEATASPRPMESARPSAEPRPESPKPQTPRPDPVRVVRLPRNSAAPVRLFLSPDTRVVHVEVAVDEGSPSFGAAVHAADGRELWRAEGLAPSASGKPLLLTIPARIFAPGRYALRVEGEPLREAVTPVLEYDLRVVRER